MSDINLIKYLIYFALLTVGIVGVVTARPIGAEDSAPKHQREKRYKDCVTPDRPRPEVEGKLPRGPELCGKAIFLPKPSYPEEAKAQKIAGTVSVTVVIDENGNVEWAKVIEGHSLLRTAALEAACQARYSPTRIAHQPRKSQKVITYAFVND